MKKPRVHKAATMAQMTKEFGIDFTLDVHAVSLIQRGELAAMAARIGYRKSPGCCLSLGGAFYEYLRKGLYAVPDARYAVTREWCGKSEPQWIARFCNEWIGSEPDRQGAISLCHDAYNKRMGEHCNG